MRQVKFRNYVLAVFLFLLTIVAVFFFKRLYENKEKMESTTNERLDILYEIKENDLKSYLVENRRIIIYTSDSLNPSIEEFEKDFRNYIVENELSKEIIYLNLNQVSSNFYATLKERYLIEDLKKNNIVTEQANIYLFEDGKIVEVLYKEEASISLKEVVAFLDRIIQE